MMKFIISVNKIIEGKPTLGFQARKMGITLDILEDEETTILVFEAKRKIDETFIENLAIAIDYQHPEMEVLEYINE